MLEVKNVTKSFGKIVALQHVSFTVEDGEFIFISGPSGAGKTTLLRLLIRELVPDGGEIFLDSVDITKIPKKDVPKLRQNFGVIFQDFKVLPERTVSENVEVALAVIDLPKKEWDARVEHVLNLVGLSDRARLFPSQLSGGELQRVSMARALVVNPKIILADEPTGNLDWETADKLMDLFEKINKEGKTIIMATHHRLIIDKMKKRVIDLKNEDADGDEDVEEDKKETEEKKQEDTEEIPISREEDNEAGSEKEEKRSKKKVKIKVEEIS
jgi:cell division transport system ATP-binding protein